jgi:dehydrogenase/reductase SDR family protein 12
MVFGVLQTQINWYMHGKSHFTATGYDKHAAEYQDKNFHANVDLAGKTYMVTGANSGIGKEMSKYLAEKGADVYMVCRSPERGEKARADIAEITKSDKVHLLQCDVSKASDVRSMWKSFMEKAGAGKEGGAAKLDGLVCNAGTILHDKTLTDEGVESTFATQVAFGVYLLGKLAMPTMEATPDSRLVIITSGGALTEKLAPWETLTCTSKEAMDEYTGVRWYALMKRAQIHLAEKWGKQYGDKVKIVTAHPGWTVTEGVDATIAEWKEKLKPMRDLWQGTEGICWLLACKGAELENGGFYLDRKPFTKHVAGIFATEGSATKVSDDAVQMFMANLERFTDEQSDLFRPTVERTMAKLAARAASDVVVPPADMKVDVPNSFMQKWNVLACTPLTVVSEETLYNPVEHYTWSEKMKCVQVSYKFYRMGGKGDMEESRQHGFVNDMAVGTAWKLNPKVFVYLPLQLDYLILHVEEETPCKWTLIAVPSRDFLWVMTVKRCSSKAPFPWPGDVIPTDIPKQSVEGEDTLTVEEEAQIMREAMLKAESMGFDISNVRMCGWDPSKPYA